MVAGSESDLRNKWVRFCKKRFAPSLCRVSANYLLTHGHSSTVGNPGPWRAQEGAYAFLLLQEPLLGSVLLLLTHVCL